MPKLKYNDGTGFKQIVPTIEEFDEYKADMTSKLALKSNKQQESWITPTLQNGWGNAYGIRYRKNEFGVVELKGSITGGTVTSNTVLFILPVGYRPTQQVILSCVSYTSGTSVKMQAIAINVAGEVSIGYTDANPYIAFDGMAIHI